MSVLIKMHFRDEYSIKMDQKLMVCTAQTISICLKYL